MKEEEAKTKWCPMVRQPIENVLESGSFNRGEGDDYANIKGSSKPCNCIASDCMMWKQTDDECKPNPAYASVTEQICEPAGHCGLGG